MRKDIDEIIGSFHVLLDRLTKQEKKITSNLSIAVMIFKKTKEILKTEEFCLDNQLVTVQISLLRLLCDNCLALKACLLVGTEKIMDLFDRRLKISSIEIERDVFLTDGYLKNLVNQDYNGFDKVYNFACRGIHFSRQAIAMSSYKVVNDELILLHNKDTSEILNHNHLSMIEITKVIMDMTKKICYT